MTALAVFCLFTVAFLVPRDLGLPETRDVEVWFGFEVRGAAAILTAPLHWAVFALGAWGFWRVRPWILPAAAIYLFYVAASHLIWSEVSANGQGWPMGLAQAAAISLPGVLLLRARRALARRVAPEIPREMSTSLPVEERGDPAGEDDTEQ
jgi:hypothetical protein